MYKRRPNDAGTMQPNTGTTAVNCCSMGMELVQEMQRHASQQAETLEKDFACVRLHLPDGIWMHGVLSAVQRRQPSPQADRCDLRA